MVAQRGHIHLVARGDTPAMHDLVEEALDAVACSIKVGTEADELPAIAFRRNVGPGTLFVDK
jgi:hypothetical protein